MTDADGVAALLFEEAPDAIIFADREGIIRAWNAASERVFGHAAADAVGRSLDLIVPELFREAHWRVLRGSARGGRHEVPRSAAADAVDASRWRDYLRRVDFCDRPRCRGRSHRRSRACTRYHGAVGPRTRTTPATARNAGPAVRDSWRVGGEPGAARECLIVPLDSTSCWCTAGRRPRRKRRVRSTSSHEREPALVSRAVHVWGSCRGEAT